MTMNGRSFASFLFSLIVVCILVSIGVGIYQAGVTQGVIDAGRFPAGAAVPVAGYGGGYHDGGFLGLLFPLLFLFLIFGVLRAVFSRGRGWGHGHGYGYGYGRHGWDKGPGPAFDGAPGPRWDREGAIAEMHRRMHEADGATGSAAPGPSNPDGPAAR
jgi:hypothetical protein